MSRTPAPQTEVVVEQTVVPALVAVGTALMLLLALTYQPGSGPDERSHLGYVETLADHGRLPSRTEAEFAVQHPPLYYAVPAAVSALLPPGAASYVGRLWSIALAAAVLAVVARCARAVFPDRPAASVLAVSFLLGTPLWVHNSVFLNNDAGAQLVYTLLVLVALITVLRGPEPRLAVALGVVAGLGMLTKTTTAPGIGVALVALVLGARRTGAGWRTLGARVTTTVLVWLALALPWPLYQKAVHGSYLGTYGVNHPPVHMLEPSQWAVIPDKYLVSLAALFRQDYGPAALWVLRGLALAGVAALAVALMRWRRAPATERPWALVAILGVASLAGLAVALYNLHTLYDSAFDPNGKSSVRYALHAYPAFAVLMAGAIATAMGRHAERFARAASVVLPVTSLAVLAATVGIRL